MKKVKQGLEGDVEALCIGKKVTAITGNEKKKNEKRSFGGTEEVRKFN